jgi:hypothetical protein
LLAQVAATLVEQLLVAVVVLQEQEQQIIGESLVVRQVRHPQKRAMAVEAVVEATQQLLEQLAVLVEMVFQVAVVVVKTHQVRKQTLLAQVVMV